jgi:hypothetical protein
MFRLLTTLVLFVTSFAATPALEPFRLDDQEGRAYHHIRQHTALEDDSCSAAAIGPHALLTATHCELGSDVVNVDGQDYLIVQKIRDGRDHTIYVLDAVWDNPRPLFTTILPIAERDFVKGERVRGWGWPEGRPEMIYREGYFLHPAQDSYLVAIHGGEFAYPSFSGDSGGAVIDDSGAIITVVSLGNNAASMVGFVLNFTPDQLAQASR